MTKQENQEGYMSKIVIEAKYAVEAQPFISTEAARYYLNGFYVEPSAAGGARIVATDGHRLVLFRDADGKISGPGQIVRLSPSEIAVIREVIEERGSATAETPLLTISGDKSKSSASTATLSFNGQTLATFHDVLIDGTYPNYQKVIPATGEPVAPDACRFNARYLADFAALTEGSGGAVCIVRAAGEEGPHLVFVGRDDVFGVLMPMRRAGAEMKIPDWYAGLKTEAAE